MADIPRKFARVDEAEQTEIEMNMPGFESVKRSYQRARRFPIPAVPDVRNIPPELKKTHRGR
ncbi:MAG: hypothetical protein GY696_35350 [Gammaproteobacteria bacterium]|nr:hypothetical protein [Gammaproteobacteria bacterium]